MRGPVLLAASFLVLAGCAEQPADPDAASEAADGLERFEVPPLTVGDRLRYGFGFQGASFSAGGLTDVVVVGVEPHPDGYGTMRPSLHVRQSSPGGGFGEDYFADPETYEQFHLQRPASYALVARFPQDPISAFPQKHTMYGNGTGILDRYNVDPVFEDLSFFGSFATGTDLLTEDTVEVEGDLFLRETTFILAEGPWNATVTGKENQTWGPLRVVEATVGRQLAPDVHETIHWMGSFSQYVPLAVEMVRHIEYRIHGDLVKLTFNATLLDYTQGSGARLERGNGTDEVDARPGVDRAAWQSAPPDGTGPRLPFPFSEAMASLSLDPTAKQYFTDHAGSYLRSAQLEETDTCGFYGGNPAPLCHWWTWRGAFGAPDDFVLEFVVEKYADATGAGVAYVPVVTRDYVFGTLFGIPTAPTVPPPSPVRVMKSTTDVPPRSAFPAETITVGGALAVFAATGSSTTASLGGNHLAISLEEGGFSYEVARRDWQFPSDPELFPFYDEAPLVLERHTLELRPDGFVALNRNLDAKVEQR